jgi:3-oxoacyl-[acyl-carrier protein] reductase
MITHPRTVLVIGGSGKIGQAICQTFAQHQWRVGIHYHNHQQEAEATARCIKESGGEAQCFQADISQFDQTHTMFDHFHKLWGHLDVLICSPGYGVSKMLLKTSPEDWNNMFTINLTGIFHCLKAAGEILLSQKDGSVIIMGSLSSFHGTTGQSAYAASKAGLLGLMKTTAQEWGPFNIRINIVFPGWHRSPLSGDAFPPESMLTNHLLGRTPELHQVAKTVFDLSQLPDVSGQTFNLDNRIW